MDDRIERLNRKNYGLTQDFWVNPDSCGNSQHYEQYIRYMAFDDQKSGRGTTHLFIRNDGQGDKLLGYITLRTSAYVETVDGKVHGNPAMEIFELAVSKDVEHQHIGSELMKFAIIMADTLNEIAVGIRYIVLCADEMAVPFYEKFGFGRVDEQGEVPRDNMNVNCVPMLLKLPEI